jgi:hypothetical protein
MNVSIFTMDKAEAEKKLQAYRTQLKKRANTEYELAVKAYEMVAKGQAILNIVDAFQQTGLGEDLRPKLAIARADKKEVQVHVSASNRRLSFSTHARGMWAGGYEGNLFVNVPFVFTPEQDQVIRKQYSMTGFALVPMIPADIRANVKGSDEDYMILWEVEKWADRSLTSPAPRDPYLLKHIAGELYAVVAEWDLTDLERSIMSGRNRRG